MEKDKYFKHEIGELTGLFLYGVMVTIFLGLFLGLALGGFQESFVGARPLQFGDKLVSYMIYYIFLIGLFVGLTCLKIRELYLTNKNEHPANQKNPKLFTICFIHDVEQDSALYHMSESIGLKGKNNFMNWARNPIRLFVASLIIFGILGIFQSVYSFSFVGVPQLVSQQLTPAGDIFFSVEPSSFGETLFMIFIFSMLMGITSYFSSKFKWGKGGYSFGGIIASIIIGLIWMAFHLAVYGSSESALMYTFMFGFIGCLLTLLSGSVIPWYVWHFCNNLFVALSRVYSGTREDVILIASLVLFLILIAWIGIEIWAYKYRKKKRETILVPK